MRLLALALGVMVFAGCLGPTEIQLKLTSDVCDRLRLGKGVKIYITTKDKIDDESTVESASATSCTNGRIGDLYLVPSARKESMGIRIVADVDDESPCTKADGYKGCIVARRIASFVSHEKLELPISLDASCIGIECNPTTTCFRGDCVDATQPITDAGGKDAAPVVHTVDWVSAGGLSTCMRISTGAVYCWGLAVTLGIPTGPDVLTPKPIPPLDGFSALGLGAIHSCGIDGQGTPMCWGGNTSGELGDGTKINRPAPKAVSPPPSLAQFALSGTSHTCLTDASTKSVYCVGDNAQGQLGNGTQVPSSTPIVLMSGQLSGALLSVGAFHTCAVTPMKTASCWGANPDGRTGTVVTGSPTTLPTALSTSNITQIAAGGAHTCILALDNTVACFGANDYGQLGTSTKPSTNVPQATTLDPTNPNQPVLAITAGYQFSCALIGTKPNTEVWCWGRGDDGMRHLPTKVPGLMGVDAITSGLAHVCAWSKTAVWCWGNNSRGQIGNGTTTTPLVAVSVPIP